MPAWPSAVPLANEPGAAGNDGGRPGARTAAAVTATAASEREKQEAGR